MKKEFRTIMKGACFMAISILLGASLTFGEEKLSEKLRGKIEEIFPGSKITEVEKETFQGQVVTEVELVAKNGIPYEVYLSKDGKVLKVEKEDDFSWFGGKK